MAYDKNQFKKNKEVDKFERKRKIHVEKRPRSYESDDDLELMDMVSVTGKFNLDEE